MVTQDNPKCFADRGSTCSALKVKICSKCKCVFYKPETDELNAMKIEMDIHNYSSLLHVNGYRNNQIYN